MTFLTATHRRPARFLLIALPLVVLAANLLLLPTYTGDDAYIHFTYIRTIVEHGRFAYNAVVPTYGSSSVVWILLGSLVSAVTRTPPLTMRVLSGLLVVLNVWLMHRYLLRRWQITRGEALCYVLIYVSSAVTFRWLLTGMETNLIELTALLVLLYADPQKPARLALFCIGAYLVRPEFILLPVAFLLVSSMRRPVDWKKMATHAVLTAVGLGGWFCVASWYFGSPLPLTAIKSSGGADLASLMRLLTVVSGSFPALLGLILPLLVLTSLKRDVLRVMHFNESVLCLVALFVVGSYAVTGTTVLSRYLAVIHVPLFLLFVILLQASARRTWLPFLAAAVLAVEGVLFLWVHYPLIRDFEEGFRKEYSTIGRILEKRNEQDTAAVMLLDVGMVAYYSGRSIIDMNGLVSRHVHDANTQDDAALARLYRPRYYVLRLEPQTTLADYMQHFTSRCGVLERVDLLYSARIAGTGVLEKKGWEAYLLALSYSP